MKTLTDGTSVRILDDSDIIVGDKLERGIYKIVLAPMQPPKLVKQSDFFSLPRRCYGRNESRAEYIYQAYMAGTSNLGAMFVGAKGTGKSVLAKTICCKALNDLIPVIIVDQGLPPAVITDMLSKINHRCVIMFDEFEKNFSNDEDDSDKPCQHSLLTTLDGGLVENKLFLFTANSEYKVHSMLKNRPGRVRYYIRFDGLSESEITEYCDVNLNNKDYLQSIVNKARSVNDFSYDSLISLVREINDHPDTPLNEIFDIFNLNSDSDRDLDLVDIKLPDGWKFKNDKKTCIDDLYAFEDNGVVKINRKGQNCVVIKPDGTEYTATSDRMYENDIVSVGNNCIIVKCPESGIEYTLKQPPIYRNKSIDWGRQDLYYEFK